MKKILSEAQQVGFLQELDVQFAQMLATQTQPALMLASACLSADFRNGHICLPLTLLTPDRIFDGRLPLLAKQAYIKAGCFSLKRWKRCLLTSDAVSTGLSPTPLVLDNKRLYLQRMWQYECTVANFFNKPRSPISPDENTISVVLARYFPPDDTIINWQKIAVAIATTHSVTVISGGPGTGKTYTVAKLLMTLLTLTHNNHLRIMMAAPTGKAAVRLKESFGLALQRLDLSQDQKKQLPCETMSLHRLLGAKPNSQQMRYHQGNPLHVDILVIDEASMIDLPMMANLIAAIPPKARVIFLGDCHQLLSVETGSVLGDICKFAGANYNPQRREELYRLTGFTLPNNSHFSNNHVADNLCLLRKSYRFSKKSGIGQLANAINAGNSESALTLLQQTHTKLNITYTPLNGEIEYKCMIKDCIDGYRDYLEQIRNRAEPASILKAFNCFRLLCALREGNFGVSKLNSCIEIALIQEGLLSHRNTKKDGYLGQPIMILRNSPEINLYNGDIGIFLLDCENVLCAHFIFPDKSIKIVPFHKLPEYETAFAMTIHKSQGSEFHSVVLALPNKIFPILTRELLYTAITRACMRISLYATNEVLQYTISNKTERRSGLSERLLTK